MPAASTDLNGLVTELRGDPAVATAVPNYQRRAYAIPNDPYYQSNQQYLATVRVPQAWDQVQDAHTQIIAIVDGQVDVGHPDLVGRTVPGYHNDVPESSDAHGTMMAGLVAANANNGVGIAGIAWNSKIMPINVFSGEYAYDNFIVEGIHWAVDHGATIINLSLGGPDDSPALHDAVKYAVNHGVLVVAAAGNDGDATVAGTQAAYPEVDSRRRHR